MRTKNKPKNLAVFMSKEETQQLLLQAIKPFKLSGQLGAFIDLGKTRIIKIPLTVECASPVERVLCNIEESMDLYPELGSANPEKCLIGEFYTTPRKLPVKVFVKHSGDISHYQIILN